MKPIDQQVQPGRTAVFRCQAEGSPPPAVFWSREGTQQLMASGYFTEHYRVTADNTLSIRAVESDSGYLICSAVSEAGSNTVRATLQVSGISHNLLWLFLKTLEGSKHNKEVIIATSAIY